MKILKEETMLLLELGALSPEQRHALKGRVTALLATNIIEGAIAENDTLYNKERLKEMEESISSLERKIKSKKALYEAMSGREFVLPFNPADMCGLDVPVLQLFGLVVSMGRKLEELRKDFEVHLLKKALKSSEKTPCIASERVELETILSKLKK